MFRAIRRKKKEISPEAAKELLHTARSGILAVNGDDGYPYAIPINFYYDEGDGKIYFHGSRVGHKADAIKICDKVCFTVVGPETVREEEWAPFVQSAVLFGRCRLIEDHETAMAKLRQFAIKYYPNELMAEKEIAVFEKTVQMYEICIEHISGKEVQEK